MKNKLTIEEQLAKMAERVSSARLPSKITVLIPGIIRASDRKPLWLTFIDGWPHNLAGERLAEKEANLIFDHLLDLYDEKPGAKK